MDAASLSQHWASRNTLAHREIQFNTPHAACTLEQHCNRRSLIARSLTSDRELASTFFLGSIEDSTRSLVIQAMSWTRETEKQSDESDKNCITKY